MGLCVGELGSCGAELGAWRGTGEPEADPKGLAGCRGVTEDSGGFGITEPSRGSWKQVWGWGLPAHGDGGAQGLWVPMGVLGLGGAALSHGLCAEEKPGGVEW